MIEMGNGAFVNILIHIHQTRIVMRINYSLVMIELFGKHHRTISIRPRQLWPVLDEIVDIAEPMVDRYFVGVLRNLSNYG